MFPPGSAILLAACVGLAGPEPGNESAADAVTLRDGKVVRGEVVSTGLVNGTGALVLLVRRDWAKRHVPDWAARWEAAEAPAARRAALQRRERLESWRRDRGGRKEGADDRITPWIDRELARLRAGVGKGPDAPLLRVRLGRGDVRAVSRAPAGRSRLLRLAWRSSFPDPEGMSAADLSEALEGRGYDTTGTAPVSLDGLLPPQAESDREWLVRRAATEVSFDPGLRFLRYGAMVVPEPAGGQPLNLGAGVLAASALKDLLGENPADPLAARLREVAARGRVGAVVTRLDIAQDLSAVSVEMTLLVREGDRWAPAGARGARVRPEELGPDAGKDLAADPQVGMAFQLVEALGLGEVAPEIKRRSLGIGAATQKALGQARSAAQADLAVLALPVADMPKGP